MKQSFLVTVDYTPDFDGALKEGKDPYQAPLSAVIEATRRKQEELGILSHQINSQDIQPATTALNIGSTEINPGKAAHSSASQDYYFSCDNGRGSVLVGAKQFRAATPEEMQAGLTKGDKYNPPKAFDQLRQRVPVSTCPILGISRLIEYPPSGYDAEENRTIPWPNWLIEGTNELSAYLIADKQGRLRPSEGSVDEGTGIGFVRIGEWNRCFPSLHKNTDARGIGHIREAEDEWMCILCTEVGIYQLHTSME